MVEQQPPTVNRRSVHTAAGVSPTGIAEYWQELKPELFASELLATHGTLVKVRRNSSDLPEVPRGLGMETLARYALFAATPLRYVRVVVVRPNRPAGGARKCVFLRAPSPSAKRRRWFCAVLYALFVM